MKKFRGKKRYFRQLWKKTNIHTCNILLDNEAWFDFWHTHLDFLGFGNNRLKFRREHIKAHITLYNNLLTELETLDKSYQSWVCIQVHDAGQDAVYIHTPNPSSNNYPYKNCEINWDCAVPNMFKDIVDLDKQNIGFLSSEYGKMYYIQSKFHGDRL
ncbi:hypothetical protein AB1283_06505 [Bacillus sp. S13(2024)]|uniref:hypothetical protein n=1 Tax=unclassified Bacillus (in: firmicutes) TaxID=185979 RepID=UPI003D1A2C02